MHRIPIALLPLVLIAVAWPAVSAGADPCAADAKAGFARVQLWKDAGCSGGSVIVPAERDDDRPNFASFRNHDGALYNVDDNRSSVAVADGFCVRLFDGRTYTGATSALLCARRHRVPEPRDARRQGLLAADLPGRAARPVRPAAAAAGTGTGTQPDARADARADPDSHPQRRAVGRRRPPLAHARRGPHPADGRLPAACAQAGACGSPAPRGPAAAGS